MKEITESDKVYYEMLNIVVKYSEQLIKDGIRENKMSLTNGFDVIFRDRKKKRK